jgi:hypothetical protein
MLFELIYHSQAVKGISEVDLDQILRQSRNFNLKKGITGCLLFHKNQFLQILEGEKDSIESIYDKIRKDKRHQNVITLHTEDITDRIFGTWSMAYQNFDQIEIENIIGIKGLNEVLRKDESGNISKEIFKVMSMAILTSN